MTWYHIEQSGEEWTVILLVAPNAKKQVVHTGTWHSCFAYLTRAQREVYT